jgi:hypothetical protein
VKLKGKDSVTFIAISGFSSTCIVVLTALSHFVVKSETSFNTIPILFLILSGSFFSICSFFISTIDKKFFRAALAALSFTTIMICSYLLSVWNFFLYSAIISAFSIAIIYIALKFSR